MGQNQSSIQLKDKIIEKIQLTRVELKNINIKELFNNNLHINNSNKENIDHTFEIIEVSTINESKLNAITIELNQSRQKIDLLEQNVEILKKDLEKVNALVNNNIISLE